MRNVAVCLEHRFFAYEGKLYTKLSFPYSYWKDYLAFFDSVTIVARAKKISTLEDGMVRVDGESIFFLPMPYYVGPKQFLITIPALFLSLLRVSRKNDFFVLRSGNLSNFLWCFLIASKKRYLREYPGNVKEGIVGFAGDSLSIRLLAGFLHRIAKFQGQYSRANSFVSEYCKTIYGSHKPSYVFSSFSLGEIVLEPKASRDADGIFRIVSVGRLEHEKGHLYLLEAVAELKASYNLPVEVHLVGDGGAKGLLTSFVETNDLDVKFHGAITNRAELFSLVSGMDLFVLPSLTEGMPRALLEAMSLGVPCVATKVGGVPEVLEDRYLCEPRDPQELAGLIYTAIGDESWLRASAQRNYEYVVENYGAKKMLDKKIGFWSKLYD